VTGCCEHGKVRLGCWLVSQSVSQRIAMELEQA
jgi:hypothetical protein